MKSAFLAIILVFGFCFVSSQNRNGKDCRQNSYLKFNTCDFGQRSATISKTSGYGIVKYSIVNNPNIDRIWLSQYFLVKNGTDTINVIQIFKVISSDSVIKKYVNSNNWSLRQVKDTCRDFYSQIDLKSVIDKKYPTIIGHLYGEFD
jgi:hypothetical protein